jgi:hypothetical protein
MALVGGVTGLQAQSVPAVLEAVLLPPRFFVGDRVELRLRLEVPAGVRVAEPSLAELQSSGVQSASPSEQNGRSWLQVSEVQVLDRRSDGRTGEVQVRVFFTSFAPGEGRLPALDCGDLRIPAQGFTTASVREREPDPGFRSLRTQLLLPYTRLRLLLSGLVLVGIPVGLVLLGRWALRLLRTLRELRRRRRPAQRARGALKKIEQGLEGRETKDLFVELAEVLKRYLAERLQLSTLSATTTEIGGLLCSIGLPEALSQQVQDVLRVADRVKFSGRSTKRSSATSTLKRIHRIVSGLEEHCDADIGDADGAEDGHGDANGAEGGHGDADRAADGHADANRAEASRAEGDGAAESHGEADRAGKDRGEDRSAEEALVVEKVDGHVEP